MPHSVCVTECIALKGVEVSIASPLFTKVLTVIFCLCSGFSLAIVLFWQLAYGGLAILCFCLIIFLSSKRFVLANQNKPSLSKFTHLRILPHQILACSQQGALFETTLTSVWWHIGGLTLICKVIDPHSERSTCCTITIWRAQNSSFNYRWASICLSNHLNLSHVVRAA